MSIRGVFEGLLIILGGLISLLLGGFFFGLCAKENCAFDYKWLTIFGIPFFITVFLVLVGRFAWPNNANTSSRKSRADSCDPTPVAASNLSDDATWPELKGQKEPEPLLPRLLMGLGSVIAILTTGYMVLVPHMGDGNSPAYLIFLGFLIIAAGLGLRAKRGKKEGDEK